MSETILVFDNDNFDRAKAITARLGDAGSNASFVHNGQEFDRHGNQQVHQNKQVALVLFHQRNEAPLDTAGILAACRISYSGGPGADIIRSISHDGLTVDEARHIVTQLRGGTADVRDRILAYWSDSDSLLALCLLCEAYAMPTVGAGGKTYQPTACGAKSIPVDCPDPCTWFGLLGAVAPTSERDEAAITVFGRLMGGAEEEAKDLARAIARKDTDIRTPAGKFVKKVSEKVVPANGGVQ